MIGRGRAALASVVAAPALALALFVAAPLPTGLLDQSGVTLVRLTDRRGGLLREARPDGVSRARPLPPGPLPPRVVAAFVAAEDQRYFAHPGIDPLAIARALYTDLQRGRIVSGASTIPQQLARQLVPRRRTIGGKLREIAWALRLSAHLSKDELLRAYLDRAALGGDIVGVETAAQHYFRRPAAALSSAQAALLAGITCSPRRFDPRHDLAAARHRMEQVLAQLQRLGAVTLDQRLAAASEPLDLQTPSSPFRAPHFSRWLFASLAERGLTDAVEIQTTLDPTLQRDTEAVIREELAGLAARGVQQAAAIIVDNQTSEVLAYAGSRDFFDVAALGENDGVRARRQPGSTLKPFAYGLALALGRTAAELIADVESRFDSGTGSFTPRNYDRRLHGPVRLRAALANSYNIPAVRICEQITPQRLLDTLHDAGFVSLDRDAGHYGVGLVLGDGEVTLYELARAYAGLARGGVWLPLHEVVSARDRRGRPLQLPVGGGRRRFLPADVASLVTDILSDETARTPAFGLDNALRLPFPAAAKTGTSRAHIDNWAVAYTRERTVAVWVGNFDGRPMKDVSGITGAGPIVHRLLIGAMRNVPRAPLIDNARLTSALICPLSGAPIGPGCPHAVRERFLTGRVPTQRCTMHRVVWHARRQRTATDVGARYYSWARGEGWEIDPIERGVANAEALPARLIAPAQGDEYLLDPTQPAGDQMIPLRVAAAAGTKELEVRLDRRRRLRLQAPFIAHIPAERGPHRLELWEPGGRRPTATAEFLVR